MPANKVDHLNLKNYIELIAWFSMAFLETTVKTTRCESTNTGAVDADFCNSKTGKADLS